MPRRLPFPVHEEAELPSKGQPSAGWKIVSAWPAVTVEHEVFMDGVSVLTPCFTEMGN